MIANSAALIIGVAHYQQSHLNLPASVRHDAEDIKALLADPSVCGFAPDQIACLYDEQATLAQLQHAFQQLAQRCNQQTTVLIYFSGHGGRNTTSGEGYLIPHDVNADLAQSALASSAFSAALQALPARKVIVLLDCCHAGSIGEPKAASSLGFKIGLPEADYAQLAAGYGRLIIASSRDTEYSMVYHQDRNSLFTKHLLAGLQGGAAGHDGFVRALDLFHYLQPRVRDASRGAQNPFCKAYVEENFPLALAPIATPTFISAEPEPNQYVFDVLISYVDTPDDRDWVYQHLRPLLEQSQLKAADVHTLPMPGAVRISSMEKGFELCRRIVLVLSEAYLQDHEAMFDNVLFQSMGIYERSWRVIPVYRTAFDRKLVPARLRQLSSIDLAHPFEQRVEQEKQRLLASLYSQTKLAHS